MDLATGGGTYGHASFALSQTVMTSNQQSPRSSTVVVADVNAEFFIASMAGGRTCVRSVPALNTSYRTRYRWRRSPSAILLRALLCVQTKRMEGLVVVAGGESVHQAPQVYDVTEDRRVKTASESSAVLIPLSLVGVVLRFTGSREARGSQATPQRCLNRPVIVRKCTDAMMLRKTHVHPRLQCEHC